MLIRSTLLGTSLLIAAGSALAHGDNVPAEGSGYLQSGDNVITTGLDGCLRTGTWSEDNQIGACEGIEDAADAEDAKEEMAEKTEEPAKPEGKLELVSLDGNAQFATDSADLTADGRQAMDALIEELRAFENIKAMTVTGHTDDRGSDAYNQSLSERRAKTVSELLRVRYPNVELTVLGMGESKPVADNGTEAGRLMNRRVEVVIDGARMVFN